MAPVDPVRENLPDYYQVVKDPVDLGSIQKALDMGFYSHDSDGMPAHQRVAQDVNQVWQNAVQYNPDGNVVSVSAQELKAYADEQFEKITAEDSDSHGSSAGSNLRQLVMDNYSFLDEQGRTLLPELLHQRGYDGAYVQGRLVPVVPTKADANGADGTYSVRIFDLHYEVAENKDGLELQVWIRSSTAWILLLKPAGSWSAHASTWRFNQLIYELAKKYIMENMQNMQYEKLLRAVLKTAATCEKAVGRVDEARVRKALVDYAENVVFCVEKTTQSEGGGKSGHKESAKVVRRLLAEAEKDRSSAMLAILKRSGSKEAAQSKEAIAVCGALCGAISKVELDALRNVVTKQPSKISVKKETEARKPAGRKSLPPAQESIDQGADDLAEDDAEEKQGYWERDDDGNRRWVDTSGANAAKSGRKRKVNEEGEPAAISRRVKHILRESPTVPQEGGLAKVLFDDQQWYVGRFLGFSDGKWHILFSDGDEDHVAIPDPDVVLLPPIHILIQALDEVYEEVKHGLKMLLSKDNVSASLSEKAEEIKKAVGMMRRNLKECLNRTTTGRSKEGEGSVGEVRDNFLKRVKARLVFSERMLTEDQWKEVVDHAMALARELDGPDEPASAKGKKNAGKGNKEKEKLKAGDVGNKTNSAADTPRASGKSESGKGAPKGDAAGKTPSRNVKFEEHADSKVKAEQDGADGDSGNEEGKQPKKRGRKPKSSLESPGQALDGSLSTPVKAEDTHDADVESQTGKSKSSAAKRTPKTPKASAAEVPESESKTAGTSSRKGRKSQGEAGAVQPKMDTEMTDAGLDGQEWKDCPPWLYMNASVEVQWEGDWWKVIFVMCICLCVKYCCCLPDPRCCKSSPCVTKSHVPWRLIPLQA